MVVPRSGKKEFDKVISTKVSSDQYNRLMKYARSYYFNRRIALPTVSDLLRYILNEFDKIHSSQLDIQTSIQEMINEQRDPNKNTL